MKTRVRAALAAGAAVGLSVLAFPALAGANSSPNAPPFAFGADHAVFVQTDNVAGNQIVAYHRNVNGTLVPAGSYSTGGSEGCSMVLPSTTSPRRDRLPTTRSRIFSMPSMPAATLSPCSPCEEISLLCARSSPQAAPSR